MGKEINIGIPTAVVDKQPAGVGRYALNLLQNLKTESDYKFSFIHFEKNNLGIYDNSEEIIIKNKFKIPQSIAINFHLATDLRKKFDLVHYLSPYPVLPAPFKTVMTVHDLAVFHFPNSGRDFWSTMMIKISAHQFHKMDRIIAISHATKRDLQTFSHIPAHKIDVIYQGIDTTFFRQNDKESILKKIQQTYHFNCRYILCVSTLQPRKNIETLLKAYFKLKKSSKKQYKIIIAGKKGWNYSYLFDLVKQLEIQSDVIFIDYITDEILLNLYNAADVFVFPSLYEGFGFPPLEAMACGTPVICSNSSSLPEVVGDAGILVDPNDVDGFSNAMKNMLDNDSLQYELVKKGLDRATLFNWKECTKKTLQVYNKILNE